MSQDATAAPHFSPAMFRWFAWFTRRYLRRHFHAVRVLRGAQPALPIDEPVVVYLNHPSWWDPLLGVLLADELMSDRRHAAPIDAEMLQKYRLFARMGFFGVPREQRRRGGAFLRAAEAALAENRALWITAQGRFTDVRERPVRLERGTAHLAARMNRGVVLPVAIEIVFWNERTPEALLAIGEAMRPGDANLDSDTWQHLLETQLQGAMDTLATAAQRRDPAAFRTLVDGNSGVGGVYDLMRRMRSATRGQRFDPSHDA